MKKVDKFGNLPSPTKGTGQIKKPETLQPDVSKQSDIEARLSMQKFMMATDIAKEVFRCVDSVFSYLSEKERTKQVEAEAFARIVESQNRLKKILSREVTIRLEILYKHEETMENLELKMKKIEAFKLIIEHTIQYAVELLENIKSVRNLIDDPNLLDRVHEINIKLIEVAKEIGSIQ